MIKSSEFAYPDELCTIAKVTV